MITPEDSGPPPIPPWLRRATLLSIMGERGVGIGEAARLVKEEGAEPSPTPRVRIRKRPR